ncbi:MAG: alpha/beta fold hydrolase [Spirochaetes bacterium]|nr:alpha/beta fold hydrolase [Spirochaetota bacterium]
MNKFKPPFYLRNPFLQSILANQSFRNPKFSLMRDAAQELILITKENVHLQGFCSSQVNSRGMVVLLHGWEGNSNAAYIVTTGEAFYLSGYNVFRLNFRDHGDTYHLNEGLFYGTLEEEVFDAIDQIAQLNKRNPLYIIGFSLGASFTLRIAAKASSNPIPNLKQVIAINPPLNPYHSTLCIDQSYIFRKYFLRKWKTSLKKKQTLFPQLYDFQDWLEVDNCIDLTDILIKNYSSFSDYLEYFMSYTLTLDYLQKISIPTMILTTEDDPVIPIEDFTQVNEETNIKCIIQPYGGHCGYIQNLKWQAFYVDFILEYIENVL